MSDLAATALLLCSAALKHQYLMQCLPFLLLQLPPDLSTHSRTQHVLLPLTYGTQNFPWIKTLTRGRFDAPKNVAVELETQKYQGHWKGKGFHLGNNKEICLQHVLLHP